MIRGGPNLVGGGLPNQVDALMGPTLIDVSALSDIVQDVNKSTFIK